MEIQNGIKQTLVMAAKPQYCATVSGEGYVDLLVWDEDDIITEAVVYISLINEFGDLQTLHRLQKYQAAVDIVVVVIQRVYYGFANGFFTCKVDNTLDLVL